MKGRKLKGWRSRLNLPRTTDHQTRDRVAALLCARQIVTGVQRGGSQKVVRPLKSRHCEVQALVAGLLLRYYCHF